MNTQNMKKENIILIACLLAFFFASGQNNCAALNDPAPPGDSCHKSPFLCANYLENYCGSNTGLSSDTVGGELLQHAGFLQFQPCDDSITLRISVSNCSSGTGLVFGVFVGDCPPLGTFYGDTVLQNQSKDLLYQDLIPGNTHSLVVSGDNGSECEFNVQILDGIGTADPGPLSCTCTDGSIDGPTQVCPGDIATYYLNAPQCDIIVGAPTGGNGYSCMPSGTCPEADSFALVWHIPVGMHFIGDSTGLSIKIALDSNYVDLDTFRVDSIWVSWTLVPTVPSTDTLTFCDCNGVACVGNINSKKIEIRHDIIFDGCTLTCINSQCIVDGQIYTAPGQYVVDVDNCLRQIITILLDAIPPFPPFVTSQTICNGGSEQLNILNFNPQYFYSWSDGQFGPSITVSPSISTNYTIIVTDLSNGCQSFGSAFVEVIPLTTDDLGEVGVITCSQPCVVFQGNTYCQPGQYEVYTGQCSTQKFSIGFDPAIPTQVLPPVSICEGECYTFFGQPICSDSTATHIDNCVLYVQQVIVMPGLINNLGLVGTLNCSQPCINFQGVTYCAPGTYSIPNGQCAIAVFDIAFEKDILELGEIGVLTCAVNCVEFEGQNYCQAGPYTVEDACFIKHFSVGEDISVPTTSPTQYNCLPSNTQYTVAFSISGLAPFKVNGAVLSGSNFLSSPILNAMPYSFIVEQANGCQALVNGSFDCASMCNTNAGALSGALLQGCAGQSLLEVQASSNATVSAGDVTEYWLESTNGSIISQNTNGIFAFIPGVMNADETYFAYRVVGVPDPSGHPDLSLPCTNKSEPQPLLFHELPAVLISGESSICSGDPLLLQASGAIHYLWNDGHDTEERIIVAPNTPQMLPYTVVGTDALGCSNTNSILVEVLELPVLNSVDVHSPQCYGDENGKIEIKQVQGGIDPIGFSVNGGAYSANSLFENLGAGSYTIKAQDAFGCATESNFILYEALPTSLDIGPDLQVNFGEMVEIVANTSSDPATIKWESNGVLVQNSGLEWGFQASENILVHCEMIDSNGCKASDDVQVLVSIQDGIYRPNVLMPGANEVANQHFTLYAAEGWIRKISSLTIYDRWGSLRWQNQDFPANAPNLGWDGRSNGSPAKPGVYTYLAEVELVTGDKISFKGDITLIR